MRIFHFVLLNLVFFVGGNAQDKEVSYLINQDILLLNEAYNGELFFVKPDGDDIMYLENEVLSHNFNQASIRFIQTKCVIDKKLLVEEASDTLLYYSIQVDNKYYRVFGYTYSDFLQMAYDYPFISYDYFVSLVASSNILTNKQMKAFKRSLKNMQYSGSVGEPIEILRTLVYYDDFHTIVLPPNRSKMVVTD